MSATLGVQSNVPSGEEPDCLMYPFSEGLQA
jgi:hypothetical protein